jgi:ubiquinone/menaquinone biosynthesis methyltransferase
VTTSLAAEGADVRGMFNRVARRYDAANRVMSAGVDILWRRKAIRWLADGLRVDGAGDQPRILDLGAGTLDGAVEIARRIPGARVFGADFAREMLRVGRAKIPAGATIETHAADGHRLPYRDCAFDGAFSAFCVRNFAQLPVAMRELRRVVRPGGRVAILEFFRPERPRFFFDRIYNGRVLPLVGWAVTGDRDAYRYLPRSIERFSSCDEFLATLAGVGFVGLEGRPLFPSGIASLVTAS